MDLTIARIVQLFVKVVAAFLLAKGWADAQQAGTISVAAGELLGAGIAGIVDLVIHSARFGAIKKWMENPAGFGDHDEKDHEGASVAGKINSNSLLVLGMIAASAMFASCAQNETNRAAQGMILVAEHANVVAGLVEGGAISRTDAVKLQTMIHAERAAVDAYYNAIQAGDSDGLAKAKAAIAATTAAVAAELAKYPAVTKPEASSQKPVTTQPAGP